MAAKHKAVQVPWPHVRGHA